MKYKKFVNNENLILKFENPQFFMENEVPLILLTSNEPIYFKKFSQNHIIIKPQSKELFYSLKNILQPNKPVLKELPDEPLENGCFDAFMAELRNSGSQRPTVQKQNSLGKNSDFSNVLSGKYDFQKGKEKVQKCSNNYFLRNEGDEDLLTAIGDAIKAEITFGFRDIITGIIIFLSLYLKLKFKTILFLFLIKVPKSHCYKAPWSISQDEMEEVQLSFGVKDSEQNENGPEGTPASHDLVLANAPPPKIHNKSYASLDSNPSFINLDCFDHIDNANVQEKQIFFVAGDESALKSNILFEIRKIFEANVR